MVKGLGKLLKKIKISRPAVLAIIFSFLALVLLYRLYNLQIINGADYASNFSMKTTKTRTIKSTRGNIYDRNGKVLASNKLAYDLTIEDSGTYSTNREKALSLNSEAYNIIKILEKNGDSISQSFHVVIGDDGSYKYDVEGTSLLRFKADVYGHASIDDLTDEEKNISASDLMSYLISENGFAIVREKRPYTSKELSQYGLPEEFTNEEILQIVKIRYALFTTSYKKYMPVTIASDISEGSMTEFLENKSSLTGIEVVENTKRVYSDAEYFASIIGYTGIVSAEDLADLQQEDSKYDSSSIVGKSGIEKVMETTLQGSDGSETVYVDNLGKILEINEESRVEPVAGNDVYLTIDKDLQIAAYKVLEQRIAGVLLSVLVDAKTTDEVSDAENIKIPSYDVYNALIENSAVDTDHFSEDEASEVEKTLLSEFEKKESEVFSEINKELTDENGTPYNQLSSEMKEYESYIVNDLLTNDLGIINSSAIDKTDETYLSWTRDESISLKAYLTYAASQNWIDISDIAPDDTYLDSNQIYEALSEFIQNYLSTDKTFGKMLYKYLIFEDRITGHQVLECLYEQGTLNKEDGVYPSFMDGSMSTFDALKLKMTSLEITPAMLALDPCSGSCVITDPNTGEILACVSYPGYDNNRLANNMDVSYYNKIASDLSQPLYNNATQARTAPGSTFKIVTTTAGLSEGTITTETQFNCTGVFDLTETPLRCWLKTGHGILNLNQAITESCNVYFCNVAYEMGLNEEGVFSDSLSLQKLQTYAGLFDLDKASGIELQEAEPQVSDQYAIQSAIGQGTHLYTTTQLARYVSTIANSGTSYNISLLDKVTDSNGNLIEDYTPEIESRLSISGSIWDVIHTGMRSVIENKSEYADMGVAVAGKTGTAQESKSRPSHALFICYAPADSPEIAMAVRIGHGYSSTNAIMTAKDILNYYFDLVDKSDIITGLATTENLTSTSVD